MSNLIFTNDKVSEIRDRASILEVVSDYVTLKKAGKNYKGLCPFHSEKTPSFMVNEEKQIFHCFGCGEGGDVFTFLMKVGHFSFPQAVEELAKRYGVKLPRYESSAQKKEIAKRELLFQINQMAMEYFHDILTRRKEGEKARKYLSQRGIGEEVINEHQLGYSLDRWDGLVGYLRQKKVSLEMALELGLVHSRKGEGWYDAFRGRIMFPIFDLHQKVVGFGGRVIGAGEPKYINSSESSIYHKGEILYGLQIARRHVSEKDCVIIVEGYFDLLTLHQHGLKYSVATLGTALTTQHIRTLKRYSKNLITIFDPDPAGIQATIRSIPLFLEEEVMGRAIILPDGEDPDTFLRRGNLKEFEKRLGEALPLIDFYFEWLMKTHDVNSIEGKVKIAKEGASLISKIPEGIRRELYIKLLAEKLDLKESFIYEMLQQKGRDGRGHGIEGERLVLKKDFPKAEEMLVRLMIHYPELIPTISNEGILFEFESPFLKKIALGLEDIYKKRGRLDLTEALASFSEEIRGKLCEYALKTEGLKEGDEGRILRDCIKNIHQRKLKRDEMELLKKIKELEREDGGKGIESLLIERQRLAKRDRDLSKVDL